MSTQSPERSVCVLETDNVSTLVCLTVSFDCRLLRDLTGWRMEGDPSAPPPTYQQVSAFSGGRIQGGCRPAHPPAKTIPTLKNIATETVWCLRCKITETNLHLGGGHPFLHCAGSATRFSSVVVLDSAPMFLQKQLQI